MLKKFVDLKFHVWIAGLVNVAALLFQLWTLIQTKDSRSISATMWFLFAYIEIILAIAGYKSKMWGQFWGMLLSMFVSLTMIALTFMFR